MTLGQPGVLVHGVSIKPGKPIIVGVIKEQGTGVDPVFGLPGHPAAVSICFEVFVKPVLTRLTGAIPDPALAGIPSYRMVKAKLARSIPSAPGREDHVRVMLEKKDGSSWRVLCSARQVSSARWSKPWARSWCRSTRSGSRRERKWT